MPISFPVDTSTQQPTGTFTSGSIFYSNVNQLKLDTTSNTLKGYIDGKQDTLTASTTLLGNGGSITAINWNNITTNKPTNFQADWNTTVINKPATFPADMTNIYTKTETNTLLSAKEATLTFNAPLTRTINTIGIDLSSYQSNLTFSAPLSKTVNNVSIDLSSYLTTASASSTYQPILTFNTPLSKTTNTVSIDLSSYLTTATAGTTYLKVDGTNSMTGKIITNTAGTGAPSANPTGGAGDKIIYKSGGTGIYPFSTGNSATILWNSVPSACDFRWFIGGTEALRIDATNLAYTGTSIQQNGVNVATVNDLTNYLTTSTASSTYLTQTNAANTYLKLDGSSTMTGKIYQNFASTGNPSIGLTGGAGDRLILYNGSVSAHPYSLGIAGGTLWYSVPSTASHKFYVNGANIATIDGTSLVVAGTINATALQENGTPLSSKYLQSATLNNYALKAGDTFTGQIIHSTNADNPIRIQSTNAGANNCIQFQNNSTAPLGTAYIGVCGSSFGGTYANNFILESSGGGIVLNTSGKNSSSTNPTLLLSSSGTVGINTNTPYSGSKLHLDGNMILTGANNGIVFGSDNNKSALAIATAAGNWSSFAKAGDMVLRSIGAGVVLQSGASASSGIYIATNNSVGIGTNIPVALLELASTNQTLLRCLFSGLEFYQGTNGTSGVGIGAVLGVNRTGNRQLWLVDSTTYSTTSTTSPALRLGLLSGAEAFIDCTATDGTTRLNFQVGGSTTFKSDGNVGIGTNNPLQKLHIQATSPAMIRLETGTNAENQISGIEFGIPIQTSSARAKITSTALTGNKNDLKFYINNGTTDAFNAMTLTEGGDLKINAAIGVSLATIESRIISTGAQMSAVFGGDALIGNAFWGCAINMNSGGLGDGGGNAFATKIYGQTNFTINTRSSSTSSGFDKTLFIVRNSGAVNMYYDQWLTSIPDNVARLYFANNGTTYFHAGNTSPAFAWRNYDQSADIMLLQNSGNLGIGTNSPRAKLDVYNNSMVVRSTNEGGNASFYLCNPFDGGSAFKTAIIAEGISSWSRSKLHFCLNNAVDNSTSASLNDIRMTIDTGGNVGIYNRYPQHYLHLGNCDVAGSMPRLLFGNRNSAGTGFRAWFQGYNDAFNFCMGDAGNVNASISYIEAWVMAYNCPASTFSGSSNGRCYSLQFVDVSDERTKTDIEDIDNALWKVNQLRGVKYKNIQEGYDAIGLIAQEVEGIIPEVVSTNDTTGMKGINYGGMVGLLINAIKEQQEQIDKLKVQINFLLNK